MEQEKSILEEWWFWVGVGVVIAGGVAGGIALAMGSSGEQGPTGALEIHITPMD